MTATTGLLSWVVLLPLAGSILLLFFPRTRPNLSRWAAMIVSTVTFLLSIQLLLGLAALIAILVRREGPNKPEVWLATAHQAGGAIVFVLAVQLLTWTQRLLKPDRAAT